MDPNNYRRGRSPPFGYHQPRPPMDEFDNPHNYHPSMEQFDAPPYHMGIPPMHQQPLPPHAQPPFMNGPPQHEYPPDYREHPSRIHPSQRMPITHRDPYTPSPVNHPSRSSSPPYKILCITNITQKVSDSSVKEALASDFGQFGDISVSICHDSGERLAYIYFRNYDEAREARNTRTRTLFFDRPLEIEPIYEPDRTDPVGLPQSPANPMMVPTQPIYSPRRRSVSPPMPNYPQDINGPQSQRRGPPSRPYGMPVHYPGYPYQRGSPPPEYAHVQPQAASYPYGGPQPPSAGPTAPPGPPMAYDRRINYDEGGYNHYPSPHAVNASSPYSGSPHEHYRPSYPSQPPPPHPHPSPSVGHYLPSRSERERMPSDPRSPRGEAYPPPPPPPPPPEQRGPPHPRPRSRRRGGRSRHHPPADAPMRFMSREYRREKFGKDHGPNEHEDGKPSRVLLINNIDIAKTEFDLRDIFESYGTIEDMEVRKVGPEVSSAIIKFSSMDGAYKAKTANDARFLGSARCRIVYGKVSASRKLWIGGLSPSTTVPSLEQECGKYGDIVCLEYTSSRPYCYVEFESANQAQFAAHHLKSTLTPASERKIRVEFVDLERSERLVPKHEASAKAYESATKSRTPAEQPNFEVDCSPQSISNTSGQKRGLSPTADITKRVCQFADLPTGINTFKQERLDAAAAAKARSSSTTSSHPSDRVESGKTRNSTDSNELNNNGDSLQAGNGDFEVNSCESASYEAPSAEKLSQCTSIRDIVDCCPVTWAGKLALKTLLFPAQFYMCSGDKELIDKYLSRPGSDSEAQCPLLSITQRWRLHPQPKLEMGMRRMQSGNLGILIITARQENQRPTPSMRTGCEQGALETESSKGFTSDSQAPNGSLHKLDNPTRPIESVDPNATDSFGINNPHDESAASTGGNNPASTPNHPNSTPGSATQSKSIRNLISYLGQKDAAGVITLSTSDSASPEKPQSADNPPKLLYTFPPGDFALNMLRRMASNLAPEATKEEFLLGVISRGNLEGKI